MQWTNNDASGLSGDGIVTTVSFKLIPDDALCPRSSCTTAVTNHRRRRCLQLTEANSVWTCNITGDTGYNGGGAWSDQSGPVSFIAKVDVEAVHLGLVER